MASLWNFVKRHKGKVIGGGMIVGGICTAHWYLNRHPEHLRRFLPDTIFNADFSDRAKKDFILDSNQRACDDSILQLIQTLKEKLIRRYDLETAADLLKAGQSERPVLDVWNEMKEQCVARLLAAAYAYSLIAISLKIQMSILASGIYQQSVRSRAPDWWQAVQSLISGDLTNIPQPAAASSDSSAQQIFLQTLQYFTSFGLDRLCERVDAAVSEFLSSSSLSEQITEEKLRFLLGRIRGRMEAAECKDFSYFVVPLLSGSGSENPALDALLVQQKLCFESVASRRLIRSCVDSFVERVQGLCWSGRDRELALAKLVPVLSDCFHSVSAADFDSVVHSILLSDQLHQFCVDIFENRLRL